jgi:hypothetical protein
VGSVEKGMSGKMGSKRGEWKRDGLTRGREGRKVRQKMKRREERREKKKRNWNDTKERERRRGEERRGGVYSERYTVYHIRAMTSQD